jgi:hypothetical protein
MKKNLFLLFVLLACNVISLFAQVEKGKWFVAADGSCNFDIGKEKYKSGGTTHDHYNYFEFDLNPMGGYFVIDKLPVGLYFDVYSYNYKDSDDGDKYNEVQLIIGPFARYYITEYKKLFPFVEGRLGFGTYQSKYSGSDADKKSYFSTRLGGGATYFFTENVGLDGFIGYDYDAWTAKESGGIDEYKTFYGSVEVNFGIVVTFGKQ